MSTEFDPTPVSAANASRPATVHLPIALLALAFSVFLFAQIRQNGAQTKALNWQIDNTQKQDKNLKDAEKQLIALTSQREAVVKQATEIQNKYQSLLNDVLELAKDDKDAREVVETWKIQRNANAPAAGASTDAPKTP